MGYRKNQVFVWFTINSQSKLKKIRHTVLEISSKKNSLRNLARFRGGLFELEVLEILQALRSALLKNETKKFSQKRSKSTKNCITVDIVRDRSKTLKKEKQKRKMRKSQITGFLLLLFYIGKVIFC